MGLEQIVRTFIKTRLNQIQGGAFSLEGAREEFASILDFSRVLTLPSPVTLTAAVQYIYQATPGRPFYFAGGFLSWNSGTWAAGETVTITVDLMIDGVNWENYWTVALIAAPIPLTYSVPSIIDAVLHRHPQGFWNDGSGVRVGIMQDAIHAGWHIVSHSFIDGRPGT